MNESNENKTSKVKAMSTVMAGRLHVIKGRYKAKAPQLLELLKPRGENSFDRVMAKSDIINKSSGDERHYYRAITTAFPVGTAFDANEASIKVCDIRSRLGMKRFTGNIQQQCVEDVKKIFITDRSSKPGLKGKNVRTHVPRFPLLEE